MRASFFFLLVAILAGCSASPTDTSSDEPTSTVGLNPAHFVQAALITEFTEEACILSGGTESTCYRFSVSNVPTDHGAGPWCPTNILDDETAGGIWPEGGVAYAVDGQFVASLDQFYNDPNWKMYDDSGSIYVTDSAEACAAAARPNVDPQYQNHCVQCLTSYLDVDAQVTYVIPKVPVVATRTGDSDPVGVALNGIGFAPPAPTSAILGAYTLAPFDDCGGHVNLNAGYHYHEATGCGTRISQTDGHAPMIGYAMDGFAMFDLLDSSANAPDDLDACRGHTDAERGYHYHVGAAGANQFVGCLRGESGCALEGAAEGQTCDATQRTGPPRRQRPLGAPVGVDLAAGELTVETHGHAFATPHEHN